jgi:hypothetical protein
MGSAYCINTWISQKVKGLLKKHIYCKYTETKLILLFNVIPLDFKAPVPARHKFLNYARTKFFWAGRQFCTAPVTSSSVEDLPYLRASFIGSQTVNGFILWSEMNQNRTSHNPKKV